MQPSLGRSINSWVQAGVIDAATADRIRVFEGRNASARGARWPVVLAWVFGGILLGAGILLFVAAHWDRLSPSWRFGLVLLMVAFFHAAAGAAGTRFAALADVLHAVGTVAVGAGIFMAGQIFHLQEHWPGALMLWAAGAWVAWGLLRSWPQAALAAILTPGWLTGEWMVATEHLKRAELILGPALVLLAATYLSARTVDRDAHARRALTWIGGLALIPCVLMTLEPWGYYRQDWPALPTGLAMIGWGVGLALPLLLAFWLRRRAAWMNAVAAVWAVILGRIAGIGEAEAKASYWMFFCDEFGPYLWCLAGSVGLVAWGIKEARAERINLGIAGFAITVLTFYFSTVMDKLGRATSLIGLGVLFLLGGWMLERARRRLIARVKEAPA